MFSAFAKKDFYRRCNSPWFFRLPRLRSTDSPHSKLLRSL
jgi:hypothetical protein